MTGIAHRASLPLRNRRGTVHYTDYVIVRLRCDGRLRCKPTQEQVTDMLPNLAIA